MTSARMRLSCASAAIALFFALASAPVFAGGYLKLGDIEGESTDKGHKGEIEIVSWSWGETKSGGNVKAEWQIEEGEASAKGDMTLKGSKIGENAPGGDADRPLVAGRIPNTAAERKKKESGEKAGTEDINIGVGELQEVTTDKASAKLMRPTVKGKMRESPAAKGSLTVVVPAGMCRVGARYPSAELGADGRIYRMSGVVVTSCSAAGTGSAGEVLPVETISLNYSRIE